jgi:hypothetical protein
MAKSLLEYFDDEFVRELRQARNGPEAYDRTTERFEQQHGFTPPFPSFDAFRMQKTRKRKRK